jgi:hypothetical protein
MFLFPLTEFMTARLCRFQRQILTHDEGKYRDEMRKPPLFKQSSYNSAPKSFSS